MLKMREALLLAKLETTRNTDALPTGANALKVKNFTLTPIDGDEVVHECIQPFLGNYPKELATAWRKVEFEVYLSGSGTAGVRPNTDVLLQACGLGATIVADTSVTYAPITDAMKSLSLYHLIDGQCYRFLGAQADLQATFEVKSLPMGKISLQGLWVPVTAELMPAPTYAGFVRAVPVNKKNTTLSLHDLDLVASSLNLSLANQVVYRNRMGYEGMAIVDRKPTYSTTFDALPVSAKDWEQAAIAGATGALELVHGLAAGNIITVNAPSAEAGKPTLGESDGILTHSITGGVLPSSAGNDEFSIVFT